MTSLVENVDGNKTYVLSAILAVLVALDHLGVLKGFDPNYVSMAEKLIGLATAAALRHGVQKAEDAATPVDAAPK